MGVRLAMSFLVVLSACPKPAPSPPERKPDTPDEGVASGSATAPTPAPVPAPNPSPMPAAPTGPVTKMTLAEAGLEATSLDRSVDPCVDFYQFACGGWLSATANQIPPSKSSWGRFSELHEKTRLALQGLLEEDVKATSDANAKKLGDFYASCLDEAGIEKAGIVAIKPLLDKTTKVKDAKTWFAALTELHKVGVWAVFQTSADADFKDSTTNVTILDAGDLPPYWGGIL